jgi:hypothetical protein
LKVEDSAKGRRLGVDSGEERDRVRVKSDKISLTEWNICSNITTWTTSFQSLVNT